MGTTTLTSLETSLGVLIGDSNSDYSGNYDNAINNASKEISDVLFIPLDNMDLVTGNILPPFNWATSSTLDFYTEPTGSAVKVTDGAYIWNGSTSAKVTASGDNDKLSLVSGDYHRLLDIMGKDVSLKCWIYSQTSDDAFLKIKTWQADGTAQELDSTTTTYAGKKNLIELEDQSINDDLSIAEIWMYVATDTKWSYFDMPRLIGGNVREYLLPQDLQDGHLSSVQVQTTGDCDDLHPTRWESVYGWKIISEGVYKYLRLPSGITKAKRIRLRGYKPLEQLSTGTDTISIDDEQVNLLLSYSAYKLFEIEGQEIQYIVDGFTDAITAIDTEIDTPVASIDTLKTTIATADTALNAITATVATATTAVDAVASEIETVDVTITGVQTNIDTVITSIATEETALDAITTAVATATTNVDAVASDIATLQTVIDTAVTAVATVASEDISRYEAAIARNQGQIARDEARRGELKALRDNLKVKRDAKVDDIRRLDDDIKRMVDARTRYQDKRARLQDKRDEVKAKRANLIVKRDAKDADIKRLDDQRQRLDDEIARFEAERNRVSQKRGESENVMSKLKLRSLEWLAKYNILLPALKMAPPPSTMKVGW